MWHQDLQGKKYDFISIDTISYLILYHITLYNITISQFNFQFVLNMLLSYACFFYSCCKGVFLSVPVSRTVSFTLCHCLLCVSSSLAAGSGVSSVVWVVPELRGGFASVYSAVPAWAHLGVLAAFYQQRALPQWLCGSPATGDL